MQNRVDGMIPVNIKSFKCKGLGGITGFLPSVRSLIGAILSSASIMENDCSFLESSSICYVFRNSHSDKYFYYGHISNDLPDTTTWKRHGLGIGFPFSLHDEIKIGFWKCDDLVERIIFTNDKVLKHLKMEWELYKWILENGDECFAPQTFLLSETPARIKAHNASSPPPIMYTRRLRYKIPQEVI